MKKMRKVIRLVDAGDARKWLLSWNWNWNENNTITQTNAILNDEPESGKGKQIKHQADGSV